MAADTKPPTKGQFKFDVIYFIIAMFAVLVIRDYWFAEDHSKTIPYSEFRSLLDKGEVTDLVVGPTRIFGAYTKPAEGSKKHFSTVRVEPQLADELARRNIAFPGQPEPGLIANFISWLLPTAGLVLLWMLLLRPMTSGQGGLMGIGRSRAKVYAETDVKVTFADVAGVDEAKQELAEVVGFIKDPQKHGRLRAGTPKGVSVAGEAGVPFFSITGSEFVEMFVGVGASRVRDLFEQARAQAPAIVFIDELDALGRARGIDLPGAGHDEKEQTLNQLLAEMDGFDPAAGIIVLAATNRPEILDPALLRAGRFDRQVLVDRPDRTGRAEILRVHLSKISVVPDLEVDVVAALTPGFTGADLANLVHEAALVATRRGAQDTSLEDFTQAIERIVAGLEKTSRILSPREREIVAHHEMGHALVAMSPPQADPVLKVSIIPRGIAALGYTMQRPIEDRFLMSRSELANRMAVLLSGRAAESLVFGEVSTGAADDLARATDIARSMVVRFGMTPELGQVAYEPETGTFLVSQTPMWRPRSYGDGTAEAIDHAVKDLIETDFPSALGILGRNRPLLEASARELLARETLGPEDLARLTAKLDREGAARPALAAVR